MSEEWLKTMTLTERVRRRRQAELNVGRTRAELEALYGKVYSTEELRLEWEVVGFMAPICVVKSKADGGLGSFEFQHSPRLYFSYRKDEE